MDIRAISLVDALPIRHEVLWPNKSLLFCKVDGDDIAKHYGVYLNRKLVCVASVYLEDRVARLRKFATLLEFQGRGIGSMLVTHIISELKKIGADYFWCDARKTAVGFYEKFGMEILGSEFSKSGILYVKMAINFR